MLFGSVVAKPGRERRSTIFRYPGMPCPDGAKGLPVGPDRLEEEPSAAGGSLAPVCTPQETDRLRSQMSNASSSLPLRGSFGVRCRSQDLRRSPGSRKSFHYAEDGGNEEDGDQACPHHASNDSCAHDLPISGPAPRGHPQGRNTKDEGERGHQNRAQAETSSVQRRLHARPAPFVFFLSERYNQNGIFGGQADQHHKADLRVNVVFKLDTIRRHQREVHHPTQ